MIIFLLNGQKGGWLLSCLPFWAKILLWGHGQWWNTFKSIFNSCYDNQWRGTCRASKGSLLIHCWSEGMTLVVLVCTKHRNWFDLHQFQRRGNGKDYDSTTTTTYSFEYLSHSEECDDLARLHPEFFEFLCPQESYEVEVEETFISWSWVLWSPMSSESWSRSWSPQEKNPKFVSFDLCKWLKPSVMQK